jgi:hypothetical protein
VLKAFESLPQDSYSRHLLTHLSQRTNPITDQNKN